MRPGLLALCLLLGASAARADEEPFTFPAYGGLVSAGVAAGGVPFDGSLRGGVGPDFELGYHAGRLEMMTVVSGVRGGAGDTALIGFTLGVTYGSIPREQGATALWASLGAGGQWHQRDGVADPARPVMIGELGVRSLRFDRVGGAGLAFTVRVTAGHPFEATCGCARYEVGVLAVVGFALEYARP